MSKTPPPGPGKRALIKSVVLHVLVLALIIIVPALNMPEPKQPQSIQAVIVNARDLAPVKPVAPKPEPKPEPEPEKLLEPVPEPKPEPKPEPVKPQEKPKAKPEPKETPTPLPKAENKKPVAKAETKPEPKPEPKPQSKPEKKPPKPLISPDDEMKEIEAQTAAAKKQQLDAQHKAEMAALQRAAEASANAVRQKADAAIVAKYTQLIKARTQGKWVRPLSARKGMTAILRITTLPGGEVTNVNIVQSSGDAAFDASAEQAVRKASPLPVPDDVEVYNSNFRSFSFKFNPEDL